MSYYADIWHSSRMTGDMVPSALPGNRRRGLLP